MKDCIFCKIAAGELPSAKIYEDSDILAFADLNPAAPTHILLIPREHIDGADSLQEQHSAIIAKLILKAGEIAREQGLDNGWRIVTNVLADGGQTVRHLHFHLLGGTALGNFGARNEL